MPDPTGQPAREPTLTEDALQIRALGAAVVLRLHGVLRGMRLYDAGNRALRTQQTELLEALRAIGTDDVSVLGLGEYVYVNGVRLRAEPSQLPVFRALLADFEERNLGGLRFAAALSQDELETFLRIFHTGRSADTVATMAEAAISSGLCNVAPIGAVDSGVSEAGDGGGTDGEEAGHRTRLVFRRAVEGTRELMERSAQTGRPALQQARRVVQSIVDHLQYGESSLVELTALKRHDEYTYAHCVNVSILSVRMGQLLGLTRPELANLGVTALLHDAGKLAVPAEVLASPGDLDSGAWALYRRHPLEGVRLMSRAPGLSELMLDTLRVSFEHHMNVDHSGYPAVAGARDTGAFTRIVAVADFFDSVTSHRAGTPRPLTGHEALRVLLGTELERFDRAATWALVRTVGLYPAGTLLRTVAGRLLLSVAPNVEDPRRPLCRELVPAPQGGPVADSDEFALDELDPVARVLTPEEAGVDVETLLAA